MKLKNTLQWLEMVSVIILKLDINIKIPTIMITKSEGEKIIAIL